MDPRDYLDARWYALVRDAVDLGVPEEEAPALVQRVLAEQRRAIRRADDPDPVVHAALRDAVLGPPPRGSRRLLGIGALAAALLVVVTVVAVTRPDPLPRDRLRSDQVPSLFGYDAGAARRLLEGRGLAVTVAPLRACEVLGRVVGSDPPTGAGIHDGDPITVYASVPADVSCLTDYQERVTAWQLIDFANGRGPAPPFAERVFVYPGDGPPLVLDRAAAEDPATWAGTGVLAALRSASRAVSLVRERPVEYSVPAIRITPADQDLGRCGVPSPAVSGAGDAFALVVRRPGGAGCPVRVDVYHDGGAIEALAYYPASP